MVLIERAVSRRPSASTTDPGSGCISDDSDEAMIRCTRSVRTAMPGHDGQKRGTTSNGIGCSRGFMLIEVMAVMLIVALVASLAVTLMPGRGRSRGDDHAGGDETQRADAHSASLKRPLDRRSDDRQNH